MTAEPNQPASPAIPASIDRSTGQVYVPPRRFAADGSLRACEPIEISSVGVLRSWTVLGNPPDAEHFGLLDLEHDVRIQVRLDAGPHEIGARYRANPAGTGEELVFSHV
jgi:uncharacterized OB-fold protein